MLWRGYVLVNIEKNIEEAVRTQIISCNHYTVLKGSCDN